MSLRDFQHALTSITLDVGLANAVHARGADALSAWELTPREVRRLAAVTRQPGMALNCTLARANRFASIHDAFPMTCVLLGRELRGVLDALWGGRLPDNVQLQGEELPFAERVQALVDAGPAGAAAGELPDCLGSVLAYERACLELAHLVRHAERPELAPQESRWVAFSRDPEVLLAALQRSERPPDDVAKGDYRVRVTLVDGELETATYEMPPAP